MLYRLLSLFCIVRDGQAFSGSDSINYRYLYKDGTLSVLAKPSATKDRSRLVVVPPAQPGFISIPEQGKAYPEFRYMGSKRRLLPWIHSVLSQLEFDTALDPFSGSGCVAYLMKTMGKRVVATDFLNFAATLAKAMVQNNRHHLDGPALKNLLEPAPNAPDFITRTFQGIFYTDADLQFLDRLSSNIERLDNPHQQALARAAIIRSCLKRQPRGVFTVSGDLGKYDDGRRDLRISLEEHFLEQVEVFNSTVVDNGRRNYARQSDVFKMRPSGIDLVYLDPPYVPRSDDNCYVKRYHFLEGLSCYWDNLEIDYSTKVRKIPKKYTPFSYRRTAIDAFNRLFAKFRNSTIVLSYSSNGYPDKDILEALLRRYKTDVRTFQKKHRYHFGTHDRVERSEVQEYLIVGQ